jgi:hypothetical protein
MSVTFRTRFNKTNKGLDSSFRGLPTLLTGKEDGVTAYDIGCFLAYDASPQGKLREAWSSINGKVAESCREGLGVHVMVLRVE